MRNETPTHTPQNAGTNQQTRKRSFLFFVFCLVFFMSFIFLNCTPCERTLWSLVSGLRSTVYGLRSTVYGLRSTVYGLRSTVYGLRSTVYGLRSTVSGLRSPVYGLRSPVYGLRSPVSGLRSTLCSCVGAYAKIGKIIYAIRIFFTICAYDAYIRTYARTFCVSTTPSQYYTCHRRQPAHCRTFVECYCTSRLKSRCQES